MTIVTPTNLGTSPHPVKDVLFLVNSRIYALHGSIQFRWTVNTLHMSAFSLAYFRVSVLTYARYSNYSLILGSIFVKSVIYDFLCLSTSLLCFDGLILSRCYVFVNTFLRVFSLVITICEIYTRDAITRYYVLYIFTRKI